MAMKKYMTFEGSKVSLLMKLNGFNSVKKFSLVIPSFLVGFRSWLCKSRNPAFVGRKRTFNTCRYSLYPPGAKFLRTIGYIQGSIHNNLNKRAGIKNALP